MLETTKDYLKCVVANRITLTGYALCLGSLIPYICADSADVISLAGDGVRYGASLLFGTAFAMQTYQTYRKTKRHIHKWGKVRPEFKQELAPGWYCVKTGARLAISEAGLEDRL